MLLQKCTASATPGSPDTLISVVCYDAEGCCDKEQALPSISATQEYSQCVLVAGNAEEKLACTG